MKKTQFLLVFLVVLQTSFVVAQKVSNIAYRQEQSTIIVSYDLEIKTPCKVSLYVTTNGGTTWQGPLTKVTGDVGAKIVSGSHSITWNVLEEFEQLSGTNIKFQVRAEELKTQTIASINKALIKNPKDAKLFKLRGDLKYESDDIKGAIADYSKAILLNPKDATVYFARGKAKWILDNYNGAILDYNRAIILNSKDKEIYKSRAEVKNYYEAFNGAIQDYNKAIELNDTISYLERGMLKLIVNNEKGAISDFDKYVELKVDKAEAFFDIGNQLYNNFNSVLINKHELQLDYFNKAIEIKPNKEWTYYSSRGEIRNDLGDISGAMLDFNKALELEPSYQVYEKIIFIKMGAKDYRDALEYANKALIQFPENCYFLFFRGDIKFSLNELNGAINDFDKCIEIKDCIAGSFRDFNLKTCYFYRGGAKLNLDDYRGAIADFSKAITLSPNDESFYFSRGVAKYNLGDFIGAIADYTKVIALNPKNGKAYFNRGGAKVNIKDKIGGCKDYSKAGELGINDAYEAININCYK